MRPAKFIPPVLGAGFTKAASLARQLGNRTEDGTRRQLPNRCASTSASHGLLEAGGPGDVSDPRHCIGCDFRRSGLRVSLPSSQKMPTVWWHADFLFTTHGSSISFLEAAYISPELGIGIASSRERTKPTGLENCKQTITAVSTKAELSRLAFTTALKHSGVRAARPAN